MPDVGEQESLRSNKLDELQATIDSELQLTLKYLSSINESVFSLQDRTRRVNSGLVNRISIRDELEAIQTKLNISEDIILTLKQQSIREEYQEAANELNNLMIRAQEARSQGIRLADEVIGQAGNLLQEICRTFDRYLSNKISSLGHCVSSLPMLQQSSLIRFGPLEKLFEKYEPKLAYSFKLKYVEIAQKYYYSIYRESLKQFNFKILEPLPPTQLIGELNQSNLFTQFVKNLSKSFTKSTSRISMSQENISNNSIIIESTGHSEITSCVSMIFQILRQNIMNEEEFSRSFFAMDDPTDQLRVIFERPVNSFLRGLKEKLASAGNLQEIIQVYECFTDIPANDDMSNHSYLKDLITTQKTYLLSRIEIVLMQQVKSMDMAATNEPIQENVHLVTRRFASLITETIAFSSKCIKYEELCKLFSNFIHSFDKFLSHSSALLMSSRSQSIYMINNYDYLISYFEAAIRKVTEGQYLITELTHEFDQKLVHTVNGFVIEELKPYFPKLFDFLTFLELGSSQDNLIDLAGVVQDFNEHLQARLKAIKSSIVQSFSDHRTALFVINVLFTQLLTAYQHFHDYHDTQVGKDDLKQGEIIPIPVIELEKELCQYLPTFTATPSKTNIFPHI